MQRCCAGGGVNVSGSTLASIQANQVANVEFFCTFLEAVDKIHHPPRWGRGFSLRGRVGVKTSVASRCKQNEICFFLRKKSCLFNYILHSKITVLFLEKNWKQNWNRFRELTPYTAMSDFSFS